MRLLISAFGHRWQGLKWITTWKWWATASVFKFCGGVLQKWLKHTFYSPCENSLGSFPLMFYRLQKHLCVSNSTFNYCSFWNSFDKMQQTPCDVVPMTGLYWKSQGGPSPFASSSTCYCIYFRNYKMLWENCLHAVNTPCVLKKMSKYLGAVKKCRLIGTTRMPQPILVFDVSYYNCFWLSQTLIISNNFWFDFDFPCTFVMAWDYHSSKHQVSLSVRGASNQP